MSFVDWNVWVACNCDTIVLQLETWSIFYWTPSFVKLFSWFEFSVLERETIRLWTYWHWFSFYLCLLGLESQMNVSQRNSLFCPHFTVGKQDGTWFSNIFGLMGGQTWLNKRLHFSLDLKCAVLNCIVLSDFLWIFSPDP